jgi:putative flippase GtrA
MAAFWRSVRSNCAKKLEVQLLKFSLVGLINTTVGLGTIYLAMHVISMDYVSANLSGYAVGIFVAYLLNRSWTFPYSGSWQRSLARWVLVVAFAYSLNLAVIVVLHKGVGMGPYIVQIAGIAVYTLTAFLGARYFAFSKSCNSAQEQKQ